MANAIRFYVYLTQADKLMLWGQNEDDRFTAYNSSTSGSLFGSEAQEKDYVELVAIALTPGYAPTKITARKPAQISEYIDGNWRTRWTGDAVNASYSMVTVGASTAAKLSFPITVTNEHGSHIGTFAQAAAYFNADAYLGFWHTGTAFGYSLSGWRIAITRKDVSANPAPTFVSAGDGISHGEDGLDLVYYVPASGAGSFSNGGLVFKPSPDDTTAITITAEYTTEVRLPFCLDSAAVGKVVAFAGKGSSTNISGATSTFFFANQVVDSTASVVLTAGTTGPAGLGVIFAQVEPLSKQPTIMAQNGGASSTYPSYEWNQTTGEYYWYQAGTYIIFSGYAPQGTANLIVANGDSYSGSTCSVTVQDARGEHSGTKTCSGAAFYKGSVIGVKHTSAKTGWKFTGWRFKGETPNLSPTPVSQYWTKVSDTEWFLPASVEAAVCHQVGTTAITITAEYAVDTKTVSWVVDGAAFATTTCTVGQSYVLPGKTPTKSGYDFAGWYTAASGGTRVTTSTSFSATSATTLYAHWTRTSIKVTFNANGGSVATSSKSVTIGSTYGALPTPTMDEDHLFVGWYTSASGGTQVTASTKVTATSDQTLYAHWAERTYTIRFNENGGSGSMADVTALYSESVTLTKNTFARAGYAFSGWATSKTGAKAYDDQAVVSRLAEDAGAVFYLYAVWTAKSYAVSWVVDGAAFATTTCTVGQNYVLPGKVPTKTADGFNYTAQGWYTAASGGTLVAFFAFSVTTFTATSPTVLYCHWWSWPVGTQPVYWNTDDTSFTTVCTIGEKYVFPVETPTKNGSGLEYTFVGWFTAASGGTQITEDSIFVGDGDVTYMAFNLYAHFASKDATTKTVSYVWRAASTDGFITDRKVECVVGATYVVPTGLVVVSNGEYYCVEGWYTEESGGTQVTNDTPFLSSSPTTIYAHLSKSATCRWYKDYPYVPEETFATTECTIGESYVLPGGIPSKKGFDFIGWFPYFLVYDSGSGISAQTEITADVIFSGQAPEIMFARWKKSGDKPTEEGTGLMVRSAKSDFLVFSANGGFLVYDA